MEIPLQVVGPLIVGYLLDLILGDPRWLPHPIRLFGRMISMMEKVFNKGNGRVIKGMLSTLILLGIVAWGFQWISNQLLINERLWFGFSSLFVFYGLANRSLIQEGKEVLKELGKGIDQGRKRLSWIVGRETKNLNEQEVRTAVFETLSENLSDGVIAPLFYYALFGVPGIMAYKMINTLDSMIGYKNERYFEYGRFAARLDDVVNFIPARITAFLMVLVSGVWSAFKVIKKYAKEHASPNAGYPEAALAGILDCRFGGPNYYHGVKVDKPYIGDNYRLLKIDDFNTVRRVNHVTTFAFVLIIVVSWTIWANV